MKPEYKKYFTVGNDNNDKNNCLLSMHSQRDIIKAALTNDIRTEYYLFDMDIYHSDFYEDDSLFQDVIDYSDKLDIAYQTEINRSQILRKTNMSVEYITIDDVVAMIANFNFIRKDSAFMDIINKYKRRVYVKKSIKKIRELNY